MLRNVNNKQKLKNNIMKKVTKTTNLTYRELISQTKEQKDSASQEMEVTNATFAMQKAILSAQHQVASQKIKVSEAEVNLASVTSKADQDNLDAESNVPFNPQLILDTIVAGEIAVEMASVNLAKVNNELEGKERALATLVRVQTKLFPEA